MAKLLLSIQGGRASGYLFEKKPSELIPFKGEFPILEDYQKTSFYKEIQSHMHLDECPEWVQNAVLKGDSIWAMDNGFRTYLQEEGLETSFMKMKASEKSTILVKWMNDNSLSLERLKIQ